MRGPGERKTGCICLGYQDFAFVQGAPKRQNILTEKRNPIKNKAFRSGAMSDPKLRCQR